MQRGWKVWLQGVVSSSSESRGREQMGQLEVVVDDDGDDDMVEDGIFPELIVGYRVCRRFEYAL